MRGSFEVMTLLIAILERGRSFLSMKRGVCGDGQF